MLTTQQIIERLTPLPLFNLMDSYELRTLAERAQFIRFRRNQLVFREGDVGHALFIILSGTVEVFTLSKEGDELTLATLREGEYFGEQSLLPDSRGKRNASIRVVDDVTLLRISGNDFQTILQDDPQLVVQLKRIGEEQLRQRIVRESALFRHLLIEGNSNQWLEALTFQPQSVVFREGDVGDKFYLVLSGVARITKRVGHTEQLLGRIGEGSFFGELALINCAPRAATVTAEGVLKVAALSGEKFMALYETSPALQEQMEQLSGFYPLRSTRDVITLHAGKFMGMDSYTTVYHASQGVTVTAHKVIGKAIFSVNRLIQNDVPIHRLIFQPMGERGNFYRELILQRGRLVGLTVTGEWPDLGRAHALVISQARIYFWQEALFREKGELWLARERRNYADSAVICHCTGVARGTLNRYLAEGYDCVESLARKTGASRVCGACMPQLIEIVGRSDMLPCYVQEVVPVTSRVKSFRLQPRQGVLYPMLPGQYIFVEAQIQGRWVQRSYTLTSSTYQDDFYEITVQREPYGVFSQWLHDEVKEQSLVRISMPQGDSFAAAYGTQSVVFFAGGIGITPALAILRTRAVQAVSPAVYVDYSVRSMDDVVYAEELREMMVKNPALEVCIRVTSRMGRIDDVGVRGIVARFPDAEFFICGSNSYREVVSACLAAAGVGEERVHVEEFTPSSGWVEVLALQARRALRVTALLTLLLLVIVMISYFSAIPASILQGGIALFTAAGGTFAWHEATGYSALALMLAGGIIGARKYLLRWGSFDRWREIHAWLGVIFLLVVMVHTGLHTGYALTHWLSVNVWLLGLTGILSAAFTVWAAHQPTVGVKRWCGRFTLLHFMTLWLLPILLGWHIFSVYYY